MSHNQLKINDRFGWFKLILIVVVLFFIHSQPQSYAQQVNNSFVTIVNPVRISSYTKSPIESIKAEYQQIAIRNLPATWLLTDDVISKPDLSNFFASLDKTQELGIFLEVTPEFSKNADVSYNSTNAWYRAASLFLSGYSQEDRKKMIDEVFSNFKQKFGYYPRSVGAWWVDSYSLSYMKQKYGITGVLGISDQYNLDGYQVWGTPWSVPYYPSSINAAIPAQTLKDKLDLVSFRWAPRDPMNGYMSPTGHEASLYSVQDYSTIGLPIDYFKKLLGLYSVHNQLNKLGQITVGLEADYAPLSYSGDYAKRLDAVSELKNDGTQVSTMKDFSDRYRKEFMDLSPSQVISTDDLLGSNTKAFWYQNNEYRIGLHYNKVTHESEIVDFRVYSDNFEEPFYKSPNDQLNLSINLPYIIDSVIDKNSTWKFKSGELQSITNEKGGTVVAFDNGSLTFKDKSIMISGFEIPATVKDSAQVKINSSSIGTYIYPSSKYFVGPEGLTFNDYSIHIPFALKSRIEKYKIAVTFLVIVLMVLFLLIVKKKKINKKYYYIIPLLLLTSLALLYLSQVNQKYFVSQTEADALSVLSRFPAGNVLVYDKDCLKCSFASLDKPAAAAGKKGYVSRSSHQKTISDFAFETAPSSTVARKILKAEGIRYVYLVHYESYIEPLPYLPQDLGLKRVYENGNAEIWEVL